MNEITFNGKWTQKNHLWESGEGYEWENLKI